VLRPAQHVPFLRGECRSCHAAPGGGTLVAKGAALCLKCHEGVKAMLAQKVVHAPLTGERECLACHSPHAGAAAPVLVAAPEQLCWRCHDRSLVQGKVVHAALEQGCLTCHDPHSSDHAKLVKQDVNELCRTCHTDLAKHYHPTGGPDAKPDPRTGQPLSCVSCHRPHAGDVESLLIYEPKRELCIQCHDPNMGAPKKQGGRE
jgi:predicted CXXCH cytochrome family protein